MPIALNTFGSMDLETLFWLFLLLVPVLSRLFNKNRPQEQESSAREATWQEALAELQAALGAEPPRLHPPEAPSAARPLATPTALKAKVREPHYFHESTYDDRFERVEMVREVTPARHPAVTARAKESSPSLPKPTTGTSVLITKLQDANRAQEAFLLSEILGPPKSQRLPFSRPLRP